MINGCILCKRSKTTVSGDSEEKKRKDYLVCSALAR